MVRRSLSSVSHEATQTLVLSDVQDSAEFAYSCTDQDAVQDKDADLLRRLTGVAVRMHMHMHRPFIHG